MSDIPHAEVAPEPTGGGPVEMHSPPHALHHAAHHSRPRVSGRARRRLVGGLLVVIAVVGVVGGVGVLTGFLPNPVVAGDPKVTGLTEPREPDVQTVKAIRPRREATFRITTVTPIATVEPYYQAGLRARVSGVVRAVTKDIGEPVRAGELLVELDVPDLREAVRQKEAMIDQREKELASATAELEVAKAVADAAAVAVKVKMVDVSRAKDSLTARRLDLEGVTVLYNKGVADKFRLDSVMLDHLAAERAVEAAGVAVEQAKVEQAGKAASLDKARADVELKRALVEVARRDRDAAAVQLGYARLYAPFDGVIVARSADPGKDVFAGSGGTSPPLVTVARTDLVTVVAKVPDSAAPFVSWDTHATVEFAQLPGVQVRGPITRYSRVVDPADQMMRVEVDVFNGSRDQYREMMARAAVKSTISPMIPLDPAAAIAGAGSGLIRSKADHKGWHEGYALTPDWTADAHYPAIVPGTTASMRLDLQNFTDTFLLPSRAVYGRAGQSYLLLVENGVTRQVPVAVQMNDGTLAKVAAILPGAAGRQVTRELTGDEVIVVTRQLEVGEGQRVNPVIENW
jgi:multidrug resistance efflux pump